MRLPCKVIEDLLPLYHDGVCSPESAALVEEHLAGCGKCRAVLEDFDYEVGEPAHVEEAELLRGAKKWWDKERHRKWVFLIIFLIPFVSWGILFCMMMGMWSTEDKHIDTNTLSISEVCRYADGSIGFAVEQTGARADGVSWWPWIDGEGIAYLEYQQTRSGAKRELSFYQIICFDETEEESFKLRESFDDRDCECYAYALEPGQTVTEIRLGDPTDYILIWQEGQELPPASPELEEKYFGG